jgi:hypothetical protein
LQLLLVAAKTAGVMRSARHSAMERVTDIRASRNALA